MKKKLVSIVMAAIVTFGLTACGSAPGTVDDKGTADAGTVQDEQKSGKTDSKGNGEEPVTLTLLDQFVEGEGLSDAFRARLAAFEEKYPYITIEEETLSTSDLATKVQTLAAADELPDIFHLKGQMATSFVENGYVMELSYILEENSEWAGGFREGTFSNFEIGGGTYGIPFQITNTFMFYNTDLFKEAGIETFPKTWEELKEDCQTLKAAGITPITLGNSGLWQAESIIMSTLGNRCTGTDWYEGIRNNSGSAFTDSDFVLALQSLYDLAEAGAFNSDVNSIDGDAQRTAYMNGQAAMMFDGSWAIAALDANMSDEMKAVTELAPMPAVEGGKGDAEVITGGAGWAYAVNAKLDESKKDAVTKFLMEVVNTEFANDCESTGAVSAYTSDSVTLDEGSIMAQKYMDIIKDRSFIPVYDHQLSSGLMDVMQSGLQEILNNTKPAETLAQEIQDEYELENK